MEVEMLQAMFMEDFALERAEPPAAFRIALFPESGGATDGANHVAADLHVAYAPRYPAEPPELRLVPKLGLSDALAADAQAMLAAAAASDELLGAAMVWSLAERAQAWLREHNAPPATNMHDEMMKRMADHADGGGTDGADAGADDDDEDGAGADGGADRKRAPQRGTDVDERQQHGSYTPVTPENFAAWRTAFEARHGIVAVEASSKVTGRQLFETARQQGGAAAGAGGGGIADDDEGEGEDADYSRRAVEDEAGKAVGGEGPIDESLFDDDDDDDYVDEEDEDD